MYQASHTLSYFFYKYVEVGNGEYITEYRVYKGSDWTDSDLDLDLEDLVAELAAMCEPYYDHNQPIYEL